MLHYCKAFGITPAEFGRGAQPAQVAPSVGRLPGEEAPERDYAEVVRRNEFLALSGAALAGLLAPPLVHGWPDGRAPAPSDLDELLLAQFRAQNEGYRWLDRQRGAHGLLRSTAIHARNLASLWRSTEPPHPLRGTLAQVAADACHLVAYQAFDQGRRVQAIEWYRCSAELAVEGRAQDLYVFAMCGVAYMHARNRDGELALSLLHQLAQLHLSPAAQCYVAVYQAHAFASLRDHDNAFLALDGATALSAQAHGDAPSPWLGIPDATFVGRQRAMIAAELGSSESLGLLNVLDKQTPDVFQRYRVTLLTDQALTYARLGDAELSAHLLAEAARRNQRIRSTEKAARIQVVRAALAQTADSSTVKVSDEALPPSDGMAHPALPPADER